MDRNDFEELEIKLIDTLEEEGYTGIDNDLSISLFDYGLLWSLSEDKKSYSLIVGNETNSDGVYKSFSYETIEIESITDFLNGREFADDKSIKEFLSFIDSNLEDAIKEEINILHGLIKYYGTPSFFGDIYPTDDIFMENYQYECLTEYFEELENLQDELKELETELEERSEFDRDNYYTGYDEMLDEGGSVSAGGYEFEPSDVLKECDPTAYRCGFNDYVSIYEDEDNNEISELEQGITDKKEEIEDKEQEIQSELEDIPQIELEEE